MEQEAVGTTRGNKHNIKHVGHHRKHIFRVNIEGGQGTGDSGNYFTRGNSRGNKQTRDKPACARITVDIQYLSIAIVAMYLRRSPKRAKTQSGTHPHTHHLVAACDLFCWKFSQNGSERPKSDPLLYPTNVFSVYMCIQYHAERVGFIHCLKISITPLRSHQLS